MTKKNVLHVSFVQAARREIETARNDGRHSTANNYETALRSLLRYAERRELMLTDITPNLIDGYQRWLKMRRIGLGTISCYMRSLRSLYNKVAQLNGYTPSAQPFAVAYTGIPRTVKRSITEDDIRKLMRVRLRKGTLMVFARDIFLFSFYCLGMPFVDVAFLRWSQIRNGFICYYRRKTHQQIRVPLEPEMLEIIGRYHTKGSDLVFPILTNGDGSGAYAEYLRRLSQYNHALRRIARRAGIQANLTSYVVRHTWASMAFRQHVDLSLIAKALGHENPQTTLIYIRGLEDNQLAEANRELLRKLLEKIGRSGKG
ncbi:MAG: tyrosine-type recombinase/integrase [Prevotella sp.]